MHWITEDLLCARHCRRYHEDMVVPNMKSLVESIDICIVISGNNIRPKEEINLA
jgi:hypothetical protein